ncbi:amino acid adenylation domain-containing protein [Streptomyces sp. AD55]|uniref:amino acid adenylation domain-containing protein n=1 Tax=Streptomyces sp. AD55 TaxID=3242895 RepID=UPI003529A297
MTSPTSLPLTGAQTGIWYDEQFSEGRLAYQMADCLDISGPLDEGLLVRALESVLEEAECARARFGEVDGRPVQRIEPLGELPLVTHDLSDHPDPVAEAHRMMDEDLRRPFALHGGLLMRMILIRVSAGRSLLYLAMHHLLADGYSRLAVYRRLGAVYGALANSEPVPGPRLPSLAVLLKEEAAYLDSHAVEKDGAFWQRHLANAPGPVSLASGDPVPGTELRRHTLDLDAEAAAPLRAAAAAAGITWPTFVIAAVAAYTAKCTGSHDVLLTLPVTARLTAEARSAPGMVANYLPFPACSAPETTVGELFAEVSRTLVRTLRHQRHPADRIRRHMELRSDDRRPFGPFVNVLPQEPELELGTCRARLRNLSTGIVDDLMITVLEGAHGAVELHLNGNPALYRDEEAAAHLHRFAAFLRRLGAADQRLPLGRIGLVTEDEQALLDRLGTGPVPDAEGPDEVPVAERVRQWASATPAATALRDDTTEVSYSALAVWSETVARRLKDAGAGTDTPVGILAEPGALFTASVVAVLTAGAAWVPLDVHAPPARAAALAHESGLRHLIADPEHAERAAAIAASAPARDTAPVHVHRCTAEGLTGGAWPLDRLSPVAEEPDDLAYVIFTSGSTGKPKGAMVHRAGMNNHLAAKVEDFGLAAGDRLIHNAPVTFDVSVWQMLAPLATGGTVRSVSRATAADPDALMAIVARERIAVLEVVPTLLRAALDTWELTGTAPDPGPLRHLVVTGEALPADLCHRWWKSFPDIPITNAYGPTECSDDVTHARLVPDVPIGTTRTPIGVPLRSTRLHVLTPELLPAPPGVPGELYVAGTGVGRGYLGQAVRTATTFVADPYGPPGTRLYRTGDHARWRPDGTLEFIERLDHQVKVRGHRVELGEIEAVLRTLPDVTDATVIAATGAGGHTRLTGFLVADPDKVPAVRTALAGLLPEYMIPGRFVPLPDFPLTPHGKVDRVALTRASNAPRAAIPSAAPAPPAGAGVRADTLTALFEEVLGLPEVRPGDSFFALGGDSITAIQLVSRARTHGIGLTPRDVFTHKTPAALAERAVVTRDEPRPADDGTGEVAPTPAIAQLHEDLAGLPDTVLREYSQYAVVRVPAELDADRLAVMLRALLDRHAMLRTRTSEPAPGVRTLRVAEPGSVDVRDLITTVDTDDATQQTTAAAAEAARRRLRPEDGVLLQAVLSPGRLLLLVHHTVVDGVSWRILVSDLEAAWTAVRAGREPYPAPVPTSYRRWSAILAEQARSHRRLSELPYWTARTADGPVLTTRPLDPARDTHGRAGRLRLELSAEDTAALLTTVPSAFHAEINDVLLGALALALADRWAVAERQDGSGTATDTTPGGAGGARTPAAAAVIELEGHGREQIDEHVDLSRTVGWFTTVFPVRIDLGGLDRDEARRGGPALGDVVKRAKEQLRAVPDRGIGHGMLRHLDPRSARLLAAAPVPPVGFNYLGRFRTGDTEGSWALEGGGTVIGTGVHPDMPLRHPLAVTAATEDQGGAPRLAADWLWADGLFTEAEVREVAEGWFAALRALVRHCARPDAGGLTPSDVPLVTLDQDAIDAVERTAAEQGNGPVTDVLPLVALQRGLMLQSRFDDRGPDLYTLQVEADLTGPVDADLLEDCLAAVLRRHPVLTAGFGLPERGEPIAVLHGAVRVPLVRVDLSGHRADGTGTELARIAADDRWRRFDLSRPPLMRWTLVRLADDRSRLIWTLHHILVDGWSMPLLVRDLLDCYRRGGGAPWPHDAKPFRDYLVWLAGQDHDAARRHWHAALAGVPGPTYLWPAASGRVPTEPASLPLLLTEPETSTLTAFTAAHDVTVNTLVQAAWAVLIGELTGRDDVVFGATVSTRPAGLPGVESVVGPFLNTLPVRVTLRPEESVVAFLRRLQDEQTRLREFGHVGLGEAIGGNPALAGTGEPFDTALVFENFPRGEAAQDGPGPRVTAVAARDARHYPLSLVVQPGRRLEMRVDHAPDVLGPEAAGLVAARLRALLMAPAADPAAQVARLRADEDEATRLAEALGVARAAPSGPAARGEAPGPDGADPVPAFGTPSTTAPDPSLENRLRALFAETLGHASVTGTDNFFALGGDSITTIHLVNRARQQGIALSARDVFEHRTPAALASRPATGTPPAGADAPPARHALLTLDEDEMAELDTELEP